MNRSAGEYQVCTISKWLTRDIYAAFNSYLDINHMSLAVNVHVRWSIWLRGIPTCYSCVSQCACATVLAPRARAYRKRNQTDIFKVLSNISGSDSIVVLKWCYFHRHKNDFFLAYIEIPCIHTKVRSMFDKKKLNTLYETYICWLQGLGTVRYLHVYKAHGICGEKSLNGIYIKYM